MSRNQKTGKNGRNSYIYYSADGKKQVELRPGENGVTEADIAMLHGMDDTEVDHDRREGYHVPYRLESYCADGENAEEKNPCITDERANPETAVINGEDDAEYELKLSRLSAAMESLLPAQRELFSKVYVQMRSNTDIAAGEGVTEAAIRNRLKKMHDRLKKFL